MTLPLYLLLIAVLASAVVFDFRSRRIPNWLTLPPLPLVLAWVLAWGGGSAFLNHLWGALICGGIWLIFWQLGWMGGGDQKLMLLVGAIFGGRGALTAVMLVTLAGGAQALVAVMWRWWQQRGAEAVAQPPWRHTPLPYSLSIAAGSFGTILWQILAFSPLSL